MKRRNNLLTVVLWATIAACAQQPLPYQDPQLPVEQRVEDLLGRLTLEEKTQLMMNGSPAIPRLGIPQFDWWSEALHGVGRNGLSTVFPQCIGMACSFDDQLLEMIYNVVSDEARAKNTQLRREGKKVGKYQSLSFWTPTINIFRDPRWGRGQESYGEDPYQNGRMGAAVVRGLQGPGEKYFKLLACAKHFAVHSGPEKTRHHFNIEDLPQRDLYETYLPAFRDLVQKGGVEEVMCAYQRFEGDPCCGSNRLLQQILRQEWGFQGLVVSDCGAIGDFYREGHHEVSKDSKEAAARGVISGTDVECGSVYRNLPAAVARGDISEEQINTSVRRLLRGRFLLGNLDPDELVSWTKIPASVVNCKEHRDLARIMAREQMVLLKNNGILPLDPAKIIRRIVDTQTTGNKIMVMGPNAADSLVMWGIYFGQPAHTVTALEGLEQRVGYKLPYQQACDITSMTENKSIFSLMHDADGQPGMSARYWNNSRMEGTPAVTERYTSPLHFDNGGNTAFAAGVELTNFTASYEGTFQAEKDEELLISYGNDDGLRIIVNGDTLYNRWSTNRLNYDSRKLKVNEGQEYTVQVDYMQLEDGATLNFDVLRRSETTVESVVERAQDAEIIIFVGGISPNLEREEARVSLPGFDGGDRTSIELPQCQRDILRALHEAGKKIIFVNMSGSAVALTPEIETCDAIIQAWYPGEQGGKAIADVIFGDFNPSGKLAVTFYKDDSQLPPFDDYRMAPHNSSSPGKGMEPGRTYRYFRGEPLFPFGYGLSYTTFKLGRASVISLAHEDENTNAAKPESASYQSFNISVPVTNTGTMEGAEVVQVYLRRPADTNGPLKSLRGYSRVNLKPGETKTITIALAREDFETWDESTGTMRVIGGEYELMVGTSSADKDLQTLKVNL
jgi:beta-glucosidase